MLNGMHVQVRSVSWHGAEGGPLPAQLGAIEPHSCSYTPYTGCEPPQLQPRLLLPQPLGRGNLSRPLLLAKQAPTAPALHASRTSGSPLLLHGCCAVLLPGRARAAPAPALRRCRACHTVPTARHPALPRTSVVNQPRPAAPHSPVMMCHILLPCATNVTTLTPPTTRSHYRDSYYLPSIGFVSSGALSSSPKPFSASAPPSPLPEGARSLSALWCPPRSFFEKPW